MAAGGIHGQSRGVINDTEWAEGMKIALGHLVIEAVVCRQIQGQLGVLACSRDRLYAVTCP